MEILDHLGVWPDPNPTIKSIFYKLRGIVIFYIFVRVLLYYYVMSAWMSFVGVFVPNAAEQTKRQCSEWFWTLVFSFLVCLPVIIIMFSISVVHTN